MTNRERVLEFLRSISPASATNSEIRSRTGIGPNAQVFQITQHLMELGLISGSQIGKEWAFTAFPKTLGGATRSSAVPPPADSQSAVGGAVLFEQRAREAMAAHFNTSLGPGVVSGVPKKWDIISSDHWIVGDAKFLTLVQGERPPSAKFSIIAEHVWLLEKTHAEHKFLVFGNDRRVPEQWLSRYGHLSRGVAFYFLEASGKIDDLTPHQNAPTLFLHEDGRDLPGSIAAPR